MRYWSCTCDLHCSLCVMAAAQQLQRQPCGPSVAAPAALLPGKKPSEHSESWSPPVSPHTGGLRRISQGFYGLALPGPCLAGQTRVRTDRVVISEATLQKQMCVGEAWLGAVLARLCLVIMAGVSPFYLFIGTFSPTMATPDPQPTEWGQGWNPNPHGY